ncbi:MAG: 16S rRNA processing protein RimM [Coriobacteriales bacterium]|nr:16S rRNA processing protein RimM [Coriobacteriales bacterium]
MAPAEFVRIGRVVKPHALKGEVVVVPATDLPLSSLVGIDVWFVPPPSSIRTSRISSVRQGPKGPLVTLEGVDGIDAAEALRDAELLARGSDIPEPPGPEFDPVGLVVIDAQRGDLGSVQELIITGANDVWVVEGPFGEVLLPVIDDVVLQIDEENRVAHVRLLAGLIDEEPS